MYILPAGCRRPISLGYLLARTADSIADASELSLESKQAALAILQESLEEGCEGGLARDQISRLVVQSKSESKLLECFPAVLDQFCCTESADQESIREVVTVLIQGMLEDLAHFPGDGLRALANAAALDRHTYFAAGCVGKFWTEILCRHVVSLSHWKADEMLRLGTNFGKALQLTNVLRDIREDFQNKRCYLPEDALMAAGLSPDDLGQGSSWPRLQPVFQEWYRLAISHYGDALAYTLKLPRRELRLRLSVIWPIVIGLATLSKVAKSNPLQPPRVKVSRNWIYKTMLLSLPIACSNRLTKAWINSWRPGAAPLDP